MRENIWASAEKPLRRLKTGAIPGVPGCDLEPEECYWELAEDANGKSVLIHLQKTLGTAWHRDPIGPGSAHSRWLTAAIPFC